MESSMLKMIKSQNPDKEYPSNLGKKWSDEEDLLLLEELNENIDIEIIAKNHNRTHNGINARRKDIAYKMHLKNISIKEIMEKTKLDAKLIEQIIYKKQNYTSINVPENKPTFSLENEIITIKNDIKELKHVTNELVEMMKAVYEFEDA